MKPLTFGGVEWPEAPHPKRFAQAAFNLLQRCDLSVDSLDEVFWIASLQWRSAMAELLRTPPIPNAAGCRRCGAHPKVQADQMGESWVVTVKHLCPLGPEGREGWAWCMGPDATLRTPLDVVREAVIAWNDENGQPPSTGDPDKLGWA